MTPPASHEPRSVHPSADPEAPTIAFTWSGAFMDLDLERAYRREVWPMRIRQQGVLCGIGSVLFLLAGFGPIMEFGFTPMVVFITFFRILASAWGVAVFLYTRATRSNRLFPALLMLFIVCLGCYEAVEAVLTYTPDLEFSTPFTLLIIFLLYLLFPLHLNYILPPAVFSSIIYVSGLKIFVVRDWNNLIQLSLFFVAANVLGSYLLTPHLQGEQDPVRLYQAHSSAQCPAQGGDRGQEHGLRQARGTGGHRRPDPGAQQAEVHGYRPP